MKKNSNLSAVIALLFCVSVVVIFGQEMGFANFCSSVMNTAHDLLLNTVLFIVAILVISGALGNFLSEFGILALLNRLLGPLIRLVWGLPGVALMVAFNSYISDNTSIIPLFKNKHFMKYFQENQKLALVGLGVSFGMGLSLTVFMLSLGFLKEALIGNVGAIVGSIVSTRLLLYSCKSKALMSESTFKVNYIMDCECCEKFNILQRFINSILDGGKNGLKIGIKIIPGVLIVCTMIFMCTFDAQGKYDGSAYQGIPVLTMLGSLIFKPLKLLFGFSSPDAFAFLIASLGSVGAAIGLVPKFLKNGLINGNDIAVFTAIGMCWSGFMSVLPVMLDSINNREFIMKVVLIQVLSGITAGIIAHYIYYCNSLL